MAANLALIPDCDTPAPPAPAPTPLRAWREGRQMLDHGTREPRRWTIADAARAYSAFIGRDVHYQTWKGWELAEGLPGARMPNPDDMRGLNRFTQGAVRADHFYGTEPAPDGGGG